jgi:hypothetical protein
MHPSIHVEYTIHRVYSIFSAMQPASPIDWADGLTSISRSNLQIACWPDLPNQTRDLRNH